MRGLTDSDRNLLLACLACEARDLTDEEHESSRRLYEEGRIGATFCSDDHGHNAPPHVHFYATPIGMYAYRVDTLARTKAV